MQLPEIQNTNDNLQVTGEFLGVNLGCRIADGEFSDMSNMTNDYYPALGNRKKRAVLGQLTKPQGILGGKYFTYVNDDKLYRDEVFVCNLDSLGIERQLVSMGAYIIVFPDGIMYNTYDGTTDRIDCCKTSSANPTFNLCKLDGTNYDSTNTVTSNTAPTDKTKYWIDTSAEPVVIKMYSTNTSEWVSIPTTYVKISAEGIGQGFSSYDAATISGVDSTAPVYNNWNINGSNIIYDAGKDFIVVAGLIDKVFTNSKPITIERKAPAMDFVCELNNRLYGCSSQKHEVYACKLGDPKNWSFYGGLDSDSYAATVGTQSDFTGAISYNGAVYFFKDDGYHRIYGTKPSNFEVVWKPCRGVQGGSEKSLVIFNDYLVWKSREGIILFDGSTNLVSDKLGPEPLYDAVAGSYRNKLYVSMRDNDYKYRNYVYDLVKKTWCIEDGYRYQYIGYANGGMYAIDDKNIVYVINAEKVYKKLFPIKKYLADGVTENPEAIFPISVTKKRRTDSSGEYVLDKDGNYIWDDVTTPATNGIYPSYIISGTVEDRFEWYFVSGDLGLDNPYQKYIKRLDLRVALGADAYMKVEAMYDDSDVWEECIRYYCTKKRTHTIAIPVVRCDHLKLRFSGQGDIKLYSIAKVIESGSDVS